MIEIGKKIGHKDYGSGELIGWAGQFGCGRFTVSPPLHTLSLEEYQQGLWWIIEGGSAVDHPKQLLEV